MKHDYEEDFWSSIWGLFAIIGICIVSTILLFVALAFLLDDSETPCSKMTNRTVENIPFRCYEELGIERKVIQ